MYEVGGAKKDSDDSDRRAFLIDVGIINLPEELTYTEENKAYIDRIITHFSKTTRETTGVYLHGIKGGGKTVMMDTIFVKADVPVIIMNKDIDYDYQESMIDAYGEDIGLRFDEFEDFVRNKDLLKLLDGNRKQYKKLCIFTSNSISSSDDKLLSRPSRIAYLKRFDQETYEFLRALTRNEKLIKFIKRNFTIITHDTASSFIEEIDILEADIDKCTENELRKIALGMNIKLTSDGRFEDVNLNDWTSDTTINSIWKQYERNNPNANKEEFMSSFGIAMDEVVNNKPRTPEEDKVKRSFYNEQTGKSITTEDLETLLDDLNYKIADFEEENNEEIESLDQVLTEDEISLYKALEGMKEMDWQNIELTKELKNQVDEYL